MCTGVCGNIVMCVFLHGSMSCTDRNMRLQVAAGATWSNEDNVRYLHVNSDVGVQTAQDIIEKHKEVHVDNAVGNKGLAEDGTTAQPQSINTLGLDAEMESMRLEDEIADGSRDDIQKNIDGREAVNTTHTNVSSTADANGRGDSTRSTTTGVTCLTEEQVTSNASKSVLEIEVLSQLRVMVLRVCASANTT